MKCMAKITEWRLDQLELLGNVLVVEILLDFLLDADFAFEQLREIL